MDIKDHVKYMKVKNGIDNLSYNKKKTLLKFIKRELKSTNIEHIEMENGSYLFQFNLMDMSGDDFKILSDIVSRNITGKQH